MASREQPTHSLSCVELLGLLDDACDALIELDIALADAKGPAPVRRALRLDGDLAVRTFEERFRAIEALARVTCCVVDVPYLEAIVRVDGERVSATRFPEAALRALAPLNDRVMDELHRSATPPVERPGVAAGAPADTDESSGRFLLGA